MDPFDFAGNLDSAILEEQYQRFLENPEQVDESWRSFFRGFEFARKEYPEQGPSVSAVPDEFKVMNLITAYRQRGHYFTRTNPVRTRRQYQPTLDIENFGLNSGDLEKIFHAGHQISIGDAKLRDIIGFLQQTYCHSIGVEFMYIRNTEVVSWIQERMEADRNTPKFPRSIKRQILKSVTRAVGFEKFIHRKYPGYKSFSLEGGEALIPAMEAVIERAARLDYKEFVIGMPHRGRLNVLANILHKPFADIFREFEGVEFQDAHLIGDVKYHLGHSSTTVTSDEKPIHLSLSPNPSHLEAVGPVVAGIVRALADLNYKQDLQKTLAFIIHGDAAVAGQGVVYELIQMSELPAYRVGGAIHFVVNNQLGFTTNYLDGRSSVYCTDVAKVIQSPIFHVNGDDVEAVVHVSLLAMDYVKRFGKDVFIDLLCYRKYGHNESDEPRFTQPILYKIIENHPNLLEIYLEKLLAEGFISQEEFRTLQVEFQQGLEEGLFQSKRSSASSVRSFMEDHWKKMKREEGEDVLNPAMADVQAGKIEKVSGVLVSLPVGKRFFTKIVQLQEARGKMLQEDRIDWAMAELLALGTLLDEGIPVRMTGQDVERGTFSQRHAVLKIEDSEEEYIPLEHLGPGQARFDIYNSLLSEYAVLGFEYGYALANPNGMTIWEAQFGDFANGAQIIIDQFICAAEEKWNVQNGLVLLLPHGYEGQGPEHSSARIERFLAACAGNNIQVVQCTTPANYFHLLRRQMHCNFRKPLVVFTPKSLLRHPACISPVKDFYQEGFREVLEDTEADTAKTERVIFCSGKIYYDLINARKEKGRNDTAIVRIEQLYPFPQKKIDNITRKFVNAKSWLWVQEEPANMGAWPFLSGHINNPPLILVARPESGSPAGGSMKTHLLRKQKLIDTAFGKN